MRAALEAKTIRTIFTYHQFANMPLEDGPQRCKYFAECIRHNGATTVSHAGRKRKETRTVRGARPSAFASSVKHRRQFKRTLVYLGGMPGTG